MMKRLILLAAGVLSAGILSAQNYIVVNSEKIFKSIDAYNDTIEELDSLAKQYQKQVDEKFAEVEALYNNYQYQKASLSSAARSNALIRADDAFSSFTRKNTLYCLFPLFSFTIA